MGCVSQVHAHAIALLHRGFSLSIGVLQLVSETLLLAAERVSLSLKRLQLLLVQIASVLHLLLAFCSLLPLRL